MKYNMVDWFSEMHVLHKSYPVLVSDEKPMVFISQTATIPHYQIVRTGVTLGVRVHTAASSPGEARTDAWHIAQRWFADAAAKRKANAVVNCTLIKHTDSDSREDFETTYSIEAWYTGTIAFVQQIA